MVSRAFRWVFCPAPINKLTSDFFWYLLLQSSGKCTHVELSRVLFTLKFFFLLLLWGSTLLSELLGKRGPSCPPLHKSLDLLSCCVSNNVWVLTTRKKKKKPALHCSVVMLCCTVFSLSHNLLCSLFLTQTRAFFISKVMGTLKTAVLKLVVGVQQHISTIISNRNLLFGCRIGADLFNAVFFFMVW